MEFYFSCLTDVATKAVYVFSFKNNESPNTVNVQEETLKIWNIILCYTDLVINVHLSESCSSTYGTTRQLKVEQFSYKIRFFLSDFQFYKYLFPILHSIYTYIFCETLCVHFTQWNCGIKYTKFGTWSVLYHQTNCESLKNESSLFWRWSNHHIVQCQQCQTQIPIQRSNQAKLCINRFCN